MSRIALLVGADPRQASIGPEVWLGDGTWRVVVEGVVDSLLRLHHGRASSSINGVPVELQGPVVVFVEVENIGSENFISAYAERVSHG